jgi:hypothetical protein
MDITGIDKILLLKALWDNSKPAAVFTIIGASSDSFDNRQAISAVKERIDYFCGRPIKMDISGDIIDGNCVRLYERDNGEGLVAKVLATFRGEKRSFDQMKEDIFVDDNGKQNKKPRVYRTSSAAKAMVESGKKIEPPKSGAKIRTTALPLISGLIIQQKDCKNPDMTGLKVLVTDSLGDAQKMAKMPGAAWFDVATGVNVIPYTVNGKKGSEVPDEKKHNVFYKEQPGMRIRDGMEIDVWIYAKGDADRTKKGIPNRFYQYQKITLNSVNQSVKHVEGLTLAMNGLTIRNDNKALHDHIPTMTDEEPLSFAVSESVQATEVTDAESSTSTEQTTDTTEKAEDKISFFLSCESVSVDPDTSLESRNANLQSVSDRGLFDFPETFDEALELVDNKTFILSTRLYGASFNIHNIDWELHDCNPCRGSCWITKFMEPKDKKTETNDVPVEEETEANKKRREREIEKQFPCINVTLFESFDTGSGSDVNVKAEFVLWGNHTRDLGFSSPFATDRLLHSNFFNTELVAGFDKDKTATKAVEVETTKYGTTYPLVLRARRVKTHLQPERYPTINPLLVKKALVALTGLEVRKYDEITDQDIIDADDIDFMKQDPKTNRTVALTLPMKYQTPLQFNEAAPLVNINRLSHDGLKMLVGGGLSRMVGTGMKAKKQPYKIESDDFPYTFHALVGHTDVELVRQVYSSPDELAKFIVAYCYVQLDQTSSDNAKQNPYTSAIGKGNTHIEFFAVKKQQ